MVTIIRASNVAKLPALSLRILTNSAPMTADRKTKYVVWCSSSMKEVAARLRILATSEDARTRRPPRGRCFRRCHRETNKSWKEGTVLRKLPSKRFL